MERGLALLEDEPDERRRRLRDLRDFYGWHDREMPVVLEPWERERGGRR